MWIIYCREFGEGKVWIYFAPQVLKCLQTWVTSYSWKKQKMKNSKRKEFTDNTNYTLVTYNPVGNGGHNMRQFRELQTSFCFGRCVFTCWLGPIPVCVIFLIVFRVIIHLYQKKRPAIKKIIFLLFSVGLSSVIFHTGKTGRLASSIPCMCSCIICVSPSHFQSLSLYLCSNDGSV